MTVSLTKEEKKELRAIMGDFVDHFAPPTPALMPQRRVTAEMLPVKVAWTTETGDRPVLPPVHLRQEACPGLNGEISVSACATIGCTFCVAMCEMSS